MSYGGKTVKVSEFGYTVLEATRRMLEEMMPMTVTYDTVITLGAILVLKESGQWKKNLQDTPQGQIYLKIAEVLRDQAKGTNP